MYCSKFGLTVLTILIFKKSVSFIDQMMIKSNFFSLQKRLLNKIYKYFSVLKCYVLSRFNFKLWYYKQVNKPFIFVKFMPELKEGGGGKSVVKSFLWKV